MVFFRRKPDVYAAPNEQNLPTKAEIAAAVAAMPREEFPLPQHPVAGEGAQFAPMFVKLDKYRDIISDLNEMRSFVGSIKQIFSVLSDIEAIRDDALKVMRASIQRVEKSASAIDSELLRPIGFQAFPHGEVEVKHLESSLTSLQHQLAGLRRELETLNK